MGEDQPVTELDPRYSDPGAAPTPWAAAARALTDAELYWVSTVRPDGRVGTTPLIAVWHDAAAWFVTGADERKARNLAAHPACTLTTGCNALHVGLDIVVEGQVVRAKGGDDLRPVAVAFLAKYGADWDFEVHDGGFRHHGVDAQVLRLAPTVVFAFAKGPYAQTRYRFG